ncbi:MAG: oxidoreductase domain protein [Paenibacillus sp.]|jgi:predicted dehydrogenase|nr:oxidoreductase domain protein [Paenibacillus sp.]
MNQDLGFAIVGYGMIAKIHARSIEELPGASLRAVYGSNKAKAEAFAAEYSVQAYTDYGELLANKDIEVVCILSPSGTHADLAITAALSGKHIVVEKPIDISLDKADQLIETCKRCGVKLCYVSQHRYDHAIVELKKAVDSNMLGQLNFGASHTKWYRPQEYYSKGWRGTWELDGGGALINQSIHYVDMLQYIMGPIEEVFAYCATRAHERIEVEDIAAAVVKFKTGAVGLIEGTTAAYPGFYTKLDIHGTDGSVIIENDQVKEWKLKNGVLYEPPPMDGNLVVGASNAHISHHSHKQLIEDFINAINNNVEPPVNGLEGRKTLEIVLSIYESARTGKPVQINSTMKGDRYHV